MIANQPTPRYWYNRKGHYAPAMIWATQSLIFGVWFSARMRYHGKGRYWTWVKESGDNR